MSAVKRGRACLVRASGAAHGLRGGPGAVVAAAVAVALGAALVTVIGAGWQAPAAAHISLLASDPAAGDRIGRLPGQVRLEFSEPVSAPAYVVLTAPDGERLDLQTVRIDGAVVVADLDEAGGPPVAGAHALIFRVVSSDGHPVSGRVDFTVGDAPQGSPGADPAGAGTRSGTSPSGGGRTSADPLPPTAGRAGSASGDRFRSVQVAVGVGLYLVAAALLLASVRGRRRGRSA